MTSIRTPKQVYRKRMKPKCSRYYSRTRYRSVRICNKRGAIPLLLAFHGTNASRHQQTTHFDTDSYNIGVDNHATSCMTNSLDDFISKEPVKVRIKGISGKLQSAYKGTVVWRVIDDDQRTHELHIPDTYYVPNLPLRLLSPQHMAQAFRKMGGEADGTTCKTLADRVILRWDNRQFTKTIPLGPANIATMRSAPGQSKYTAFAAKCEGVTNEPVAYDAHWIPPDPEEDMREATHQREIEA